MTTPLTQVYTSAEYATNVTSGPIAAGPYHINSNGLSPSTMSSSATLELTGEGADIVINGVSLSKSIATINKRLLIVEPKKELLDKYEALQEAYDHYKTLEALLHD
jgi:hypothetical protein